MYSIVDRMLLTICCLAYSIIISGNFSSLVPFLLMIVLQSFMIYFDRSDTSFTCIILILALCFFFPVFCPFLPLAVYEICRRKFYYFLAPAGLLLVLSINSSAPQPYLILAMLLLFAFMTERRTLRLQELKSRYFSLRDSSREWQLSMEHKARELMEKQDYEVHVATLQERTRIAREIHDNVGHLLSRSLLVVGALEAVNRDEKLADSLQDLHSSLSTAMDTIRKSVHDLHDEGIDLHAALMQLVKEFTFCPLTFDYDLEGGIDRKLKYSLISIVKEALSNIIKHSNATKASIVLREHPALYQLIIQDNGTTSDSLSAPAEESGIGLENMKDRVEVYQGRITITAEDGFRIFIIIPKKDGDSGRQDTAGTKHIYPIKGDSL